MASGHKDYYSGVDVAYQALSEMTVRPKYGGAVVAQGSKTVTPGQSTKIVEVFGKGMIYGGAVWLDYTYSQANDIVSIVIEEGSGIGLSFLRMQQYSINRALTFPVTINIYDAVNYIYSVGISYGLTFEERLALYYVETYGRDPKVFYSLIYSLI